MNSETEQAKQFYANFQILDLNINRIQRKNIHMRNLLLLLITQLFLISFFIIMPWIN